MRREDFWCQKGLLKHGAHLHSSGRPIPHHPHLLRHALASLPLKEKNKSETIYEKMKKWFTCLWNFRQRECSFLFTVFNRPGRICCCNRLFSFDKARLAMRSSSHWSSSSCWRRRSIWFSSWTSSFSFFLSSSFRLALRIWSEMFSSLSYSESFAWLVWSFDSRS